MGKSKGHNVGNGPGHDVAIENSPGRLRSVDEHQAAILAGIDPLPVSEVSLLEALGQVLARDVIAQWPLPSFDNSSMDGYAVLAADVAGASESVPVLLPVMGDLAAGGELVGEVRPGTAMRIMTGAPMPPGADAVVPVEGTDGGVAEVSIMKSAAVGDCIRRAGEDVTVGDVVLAAGAVISERSIPVVAAVGYGTVPVFARPRVVVISTGDELVEPGTPLTHGRISETNGTMLVACARAAGAIAHRAPIVRDDADEFTAALQVALASADIIVTSGGVSMGAFDTVKAVLRDSGDVEFVKVAMHPGMPQGQGRLGDGRVPIVTLPGNPVSSFISFELYVRPLIRRMMGHERLMRPTEAATCTQAFRSSAGKRQFARAVLTVNADGQRTVTPVGGQGSHIMGGLARADALIVVPEHVEDVRVGDTVTVIDLQRETS